MTTTTHLETVSLDLLDAVERSTAARDHGDRDHAAYWSGYSLGLLLALGRGPHIDRYDVLHDTLDTARMDPYAQRGDIVQTLSQRSRVWLHNGTAHQLASIQRCGLLAGWYDGTLGLHDAQDCAGCGERILTDDPGEDFVECETHGPVHHECIDSCNRGCSTKEWAA